MEIPLDLDMVEKKVLMETMTWQEVSDALKESDIVLVPIGSEEPHGPHCPLSTDSINALSVARRAAEKLREEFPVLVAPLIPVGCSWEHKDFPGFIALKTSTLTQVVLDISRSLSTQGFRKIVFVNGHGGNSACLNAAAVTVRDELGLQVSVVTWWDLIKDKISIDHAGWVETSMVMANRPELVQRSKIPGPFEKPAPKGAQYGVATPMSPLKTLSPEGYIGDPTKSSEEKGKELTEAASDRLAQYLREARESAHIKRSVP